MDAAVSSFSWDGVIASLGVVGALVWYLYYNTSVVIPNMQKQHREDMAAMNTLHIEEMDLVTAKHDGTIEKIVTRYEKELDRERGDCGETIKAMSAEIRELRDKVYNMPAQLYLGQKQEKTGT